MRISALATIYGLSSARCYVYHRMSASVGCGGHLMVRLNVDAISVVISFVGRMISNSIFALGLRLTWSETRYDPKFDMNVSWTDGLMFM